MDTGSCAPMIDYIRVTFPDTMTPEEVGLQLDFAGDWEERGFGTRGYTESAVLHGMTMSWGGSRGIHVNIPGQSCRYLEGVEGWDWQYQFKRWGLLGAHFTRLDVCFDDKQGLLDLDVLAQQVGDGVCTTRARRWNGQGSGAIGAGVAGLGRSIAVGNAVSDTFLLFYDKAKEQGVLGPWIRCEIRWYRDRADVAAQRFVLGGPEVFAGLLAGHILFRERGHQKAKVEWPVADWWRRFLGYAKVERLRIAKAEADIARVVSWFVRSMGPILAVVREGLGASEGVLDVLADGGRVRWGPRHRALAAQYR